MAVYLVQGRLGSGKSLLVTTRIWHTYVAKGRAVAINYPLYCEHSPYPWSKSPMWRLPDWPTSKELQQLPAICADGKPTQETIAEMSTWSDDRLKHRLGGSNEEMHGALVLDEASHYLNSRQWQHTDRSAVVTWLSQARKYGWDVYVLVQHHSMVDKQIREAFSEMHVECKRADRVRIPLIGSLFALAGVDLRLPKWFLGIVRYGTGHSVQLSDRWHAVTSSIMRSYDTRYIFGNQQSLICMLNPYMYYGRTVSPWFHSARLIIETAAYFCRSWRAHIISAAGIGLACGLYIASSRNELQPETSAQAITQAAAVPAIQKKKGKFPDLVGWFGSEPLYELNGEPVEVQITIDAFTQNTQHCYEDECIDVP